MPSETLTAMDIQEDTICAATQELPQAAAHALLEIATQEIPEAASQALLETATQEVPHIAARASLEAAAQETPQTVADALLEGKTQGVPRAAAQELLEPATQELSRAAALAMNSEAPTKDLCVATEQGSPRRDSMQAMPPTLTGMADDELQDDVSQESFHNSPAGVRVLGAGRMLQDDDDEEEDIVGGIKKRRRRVGTQLADDDDDEDQIVANRQTNATLSDQENDEDDIPGSNATPEDTQTHSKIQASENEGNGGSQSDDDNGDGVDDEKSHDGAKKRNNGENEEEEEEDDGQHSSGSPAQSDDEEDIFDATQRVLRESALHDGLGKGFCPEPKPMDGLLAKILLRKQTVMQRAAKTMQSIPQAVEAKPKPKDMATLMQGAALMRAEQLKATIAKKQAVDVADDSDDDLEIVDMADDEDEDESSQGAAMAKLPETAPQPHLSLVLEATQKPTLGTETMDMESEPNELHLTLEPTQIEHEGLDKPLSAIPAPAAPQAPIQAEAAKPGSTTDAITAASLATAAIAAMEAQPPIAANAATAVKAHTAANAATEAQPAPAATKLKPASQLQRWLATAAKPSVPPQATTSAEPSNPAGQGKQAGTADQTKTNPSTTVNAGTENVGKRTKKGEMKAAATKPAGAAFVDDEVMEDAEEEEELAGDVAEDEGEEEDSGSAEEDDEDEEEEEEEEEEDKRVEEEMPEPEALHIEEEDGADLPPSPSRPGKWVATSALIKPKGKGAARFLEAEAELSEDEEGFLKAGSDDEEDDDDDGVLEDLIGEVEEGKHDEKRRLEAHKRWEQEQDDKQTKAIWKGIQTGFRRPSAADDLFGDAEGSNRAAAKRMRRKLRASKKEQNGEENDDEDDGGESDGGAESGEDEEDEEKEISAFVRHYKQRRLHMKLASSKQDGGGLLAMSMDDSSREVMSLISRSNSQSLPAVQPDKSHNATSNAKPVGAVDNFQFNMFGRDTTNTRPDNQKTTFLGRQNSGSNSAFHRSTSSVASGRFFTFSVEHNSNGAKSMPPAEPTQAEAKPAAETNCPPPPATTGAPSSSGASFANLRKLIAQDKPPKQQTCSNPTLFSLLSEKSSSRPMALPADDKAAQRLRAAVNASFAPSLPRR